VLRNALVSDCREIGVKPLSRWTADFCAEWLDENIKYESDTERLNIWVSNTGIWTVGIVEDGKVKRIIAIGHSLSEALRAAVLAVAEETGQVLNAK